MRELSLSEVDAICGGYAKMQMASYYDTGLRKTGAGPSAASGIGSPSPALSRTPAQPSGESVGVRPTETVSLLNRSNRDEVLLELDLSDTPRVMPQTKSPEYRPEMDKTLAPLPEKTEEAKIYRIQFKDRQGNSVAKDVSQSEYDIVVRELRRFGVHYTASML